MPSREKRTKPDDSRQIGCRAGNTDRKNEDGVVAGYLSTFWAVDSYGTAFAPGVFDKMLRQRGDKLLLLYQYNYNPDWAIGRLTNTSVDEGTVTLKCLRAGVPFGHSHGFRTIYERPAEDEDPLVFTANSPEWAKRNPDAVWVIEATKEYERSIVTFPANVLAIITDVRTDLELQTLSHTLEALRTGTISPAQRALIAELTAAWQAGRSCTRSHQAPTPRHGPTAKPPSPRCSPPAG